MKKIATMSLFFAMASGAAAADNSKGAVFGIECTRWAADARQIYCGEYPWRRNDPVDLTFNNVKDIYARGYRVTAVLSNSERTMFVIEKQQ